MMGWMGRHCSWRLVSAIAAGIALALFLSLVPITRYVPACGPRRSIPLDGPLREQYVIILSHYMDQENFRYWRRGNKIYIPLLDIRGGNELFRSRRDFLANAGRKIASSIANGVILNGRHFPPPPPTREPIDEMERKCGSYPRPADDRSRGGRDRRFDFECFLMRAAIVEVETMENAGASR